MKHTAHRSIYFRLDKYRRKTYYLRLYSGGRQTWRSVGPRLDDALRIQAEIRIRRVEEKFGITHVVNITFNEIALEYLKYYDAKGSPDNQCRVRSLLKHLSAFFGPLDLKAINAWTIEGYVRHRTDDHAKPRTINTELDYLRAALGKAVEWGFLESIPRVKKLPVQEEGPARELGIQEIDKIMALVSEDHRDAIVIALYTGMRLGEIYRLRPEHWDRGAGTVLIERTKSGKVREIPLTGRVSEILAIRFARYKTRLFPDKSVDRLIGRFAYERKKLKGFTRWRFHDLRHTFASWVIKAGVDPRTAMELLGHSSLDMTTRYTHTSLDRKRAAIALLEPTNKRIINGAKKK